LLDHMPDIYLTTDEPTKTTLMMVVGEGTAYEGKKGHTFSSFRDGLSKTIMVVRAGDDKAVPWTKPADLPFDPDNPVAAFGKIESNKFIVLMTDGSVHRFPKQTAPETWRGFLTRAGGEKVTLPGPTAKRFDISGKVSFNDGKPLTSGRIVFARDGTEGFTHMNADGTYSLSKLREGTYTVYVAEPNDGGESGRTLPPVHPKYLSLKTSSIHLDLKSDTSFDIAIERP
jgi:sugar lactone lactonase YvrE